MINFVPVPKNSLLTLAPEATQYVTTEQKLISLETQD